MWVLIVKWIGSPPGVINSFKRNLTIQIELVERAEVKGNPQKNPLDEKQAKTLRGGHTDTDAGSGVELSGTEHELRF